VSPGQGRSRTSTMAPGTDRDLLDRPLAATRVARQRASASSSSSSSRSADDRSSTAARPQRGRDDDPGS
jgi:hypothetical protein